MKTMLKIASTIAGLVLIGLLAAGAWLLLRKLGSLESLGLACAAAIVCAVIIAGGLRARASSLALEAEKMAVYQAVVEAAGEALRGGGEPRLASLGPLLVLRAGPRVLQAYAAVSEAGPELPPALIRLVEEMRRDLGLRSPGLPERDWRLLLGGTGDTLAQSSAPAVKVSPPVSIRS